MFYQLLLHITIVAFLFCYKYTLGYMQIIGPREILYNKRISCQSSQQVEFIERSEIMYNKCMLIKCPFLRRRSMDFVETALSLYKFVILTRHKSIEIPGIRLENYNQHALTISKKTPNLCLSQIGDIILSDWRGKNPIEFDGKGDSILNIANFNFV